MASQVKLNSILCCICFSFDTAVFISCFTISCILAQLSMKIGLSLIGKTIDCECLTIKLCGTCVDVKEACGNGTSENYIMRLCNLCCAPNVLSVKKNYHSA